ncbi:MAG: stage 0 sporulation family protein, partial [Clostridia bacterium]|nr:stage 0 sporulation family protein [Clostridia bacterium]
MEKVIGVRFKRVGKIYYFTPGSIVFKKGDFAIVETSKGTEYGEVVIDSKEVNEKDLVAPLKKVVRRANSKDEKKIEDNKRKQAGAFKTCQEKIANHGLDMKLVDVEHTFDNSRIVFYFTADGRVDFRELVKDLAGVFKTRIELRQIGVRDEAKMLGGLGPCGRECCCSYFLGDFNPVSIKMAKEQNLSLSPTKISGLCGRLMCCLNYEHEHYKETKRRMPRQGSTVETPNGNGVVLDNNAITEKVRVKIVLPDESYDIESFDLADIVVIKSAARPQGKGKGKQQGKGQGKQQGNPQDKPQCNGGCGGNDKPCGKHQGEAGEDEA